MDWAGVIILFLAGVLGASGLIVSKKPNAKDLIAKIAPFQGIIGVLCLLLGVWGLITCIRFLSAGLHLPSLVLSIVAILLGALLGFGLIKTFIKNEEAVTKINEKLLKVAPFQGILGLVAIGVAIWNLISIITR